MNCYHCPTKLIFTEEYDIAHEDESYKMQTHLFCPNCKSVVHVYFPKEKPTIQKKQI